MSGARQPRFLRILQRRESAILVLALLFLAAELHHGRFFQYDFRSYYQAAGRFLAAESLYLVTDAISTARFLYLPFVALWFVPFRLINIESASLTWYLINVALIIGLWRLLRRSNGPLELWGDLVFFFAIGFTLERELHVGNINLLALVLSLGAAAGALHRQGWRAAALLVAAASIKPHFALLALPVVGKLPRSLVALVVFGLLSALTPLPYYGLAGTGSLYADFLQSALEFADHYADTFKFNSTTAGLLNQLLTGLGGPPLSRIAASAVNGLAALCVVFAARKRFGWSRRTMALTLAAVPLLATSDYQVFIFCAPLLYVLLADWPCWRHSPWKFALVAISLFVYGCNWHDLWGDRLSDAMFHVGLHGLGAWGMIVAAFLVSPKTDRAPEAIRARAALQSPKRGTASGSVAQP